ncbi:MAG: ATP-binding protein [Phycisphaerae bacterium]|nr:ATP-binding protein [Phycisphaerae bacterium]
MLPTFRRWAFERLLSSVRTGLTPITVVRGPRQVGKSTLQDQVIAKLLDDGVHPTRILKVQFDEIAPLLKQHTPILAICWWFESQVLKRTLNEAAHAGEPAYLFLDEVQNLTDWAAELKSLVDNRTVRVLVTGSSALRIESGRDSLAGRISTIELGPLLLREVSELGLGTPLPPVLADNGLERLVTKDLWSEIARHGRQHVHPRDEAFKRWSARGGYPRAQERFDAPWEDVASNLVETVVDRAIQHDLRQGERGRKRDESLLREVFKLACRYTGQSPTQSVFIEDIRSSLGGNVGWQRVQNYLRFLEGAMLLRLIEPLELRLKRKRGAPKVCVCDHALRAAWLHEVVPLDPDGLERMPHLADLAGRLAESVAGYFLSSIPHLGVNHFPARGAEPEVDFVLTVGERRVPVEIKYRRRIDPHEDTRGIRAFVEKAAYNAPFGVLVTLLDDVVVDDPRVVPVSLRSLLLLR